MITAAPKCRRLFFYFLLNTNLQESLGLQGTITLESHTNISTVQTSETVSPIDEALPETMNCLALGGGSANTASAASALRLSAPPKRATKKGKGILADQFCIHRKTDGRHVPVLAIEYKAPHNLSVEEVITTSCTWCHMTRHSIRFGTAPGCRPPSIPTSWRTQISWSSSPLALRLLFLAYQAKASRVDHSLDDGVGTFLDSGCTQQLTKCCALFSVSCT